MVSRSHLKSPVESQVYCHISGASQETRERPVTPSLPPAPTRALYRITPYGFAFDIILLKSP
jgi:hypothetical protein